jgi:DNA-binding CsgD family transcriptional regulator
MCVNDAVTQLAGTLVRRSVQARDYASARRWLDRALVCGGEQGLEQGFEWGRLCLIAWRARLQAETGQWPKAEAECLLVINHPQPAMEARIQALTTLGLLHARQQIPDAGELLDEALTFALMSADAPTLASQRSVTAAHPSSRTDSVGASWLVPIRAARAELALLRGQTEIARAEADAGLALVAPTELFWEWEGLRYLKWRAASGWRAPHASVHTQDPVFGPYCLQVRGHWRAAADAWARLGCPYERADALADGDGAAMEEALAIFAGLGAAPAADRVRRDLRRVGAKRPRRGPRRSTTAHPAGLTARESEILALLAGHLSNLAIGERLFVSPKTVEHHVSAILGKLQVATRAEAVLKARHRGWLAERRATDSAA